jgi:alpha-N-arabinofuranosidase
MALYAGELKPRVAKLSLTADKLAQGDRSVPVADGIATVDESGKAWAIALVNRHPDHALAYTVKFSDLPLEGTYDGVVLSGDSPEAFNDIEHPTRVVPENRQFTFADGAVELPPHSLTILKISRP